MGAPRILVVDDDPKVLSLLRRGLILDGYNVDTAADGETALSQARDFLPDLVILDLMLPGLDGIEVCRRLRAVDEHLPILMLTAKDQVPDRVAGLDAGADDYLVKPFAFDELLARIRALLRRSASSGEESLRFGALTMDPATRQVEIGGRRLTLTAKEHDLLELFLRHPRQVFSREQIFDRVWGAEYFAASNIIDVHVMRLREKLEAAGERRLLQTIRGAGYSLRED